MRRKTSRRNTKQRTIILEELKKVKTHPTADVVFKIVRRRLPSLSFGTVYRNLNLLKDEGQILELVCGKYSCHYDGNTDPHYHLLCLKCKKIFDLDELMLKNLEKIVMKKCDFTVKYYRMDFYGYCRGCRA